MSEEDILKRLDGIEHQLKFFTDAYKHLHNACIQQKYLIANKEILQPTLSDLGNQIKEFSNLYLKLNDVIKKDSILGTLAFMAKRIHEMEATLSKLKDEGIKKKIHLDFTIDGYEMVKRKSDIISMNYENPEDTVKQLLNTLTEREAQVLIHRYGLFEESAKTLKATGKCMGTSSERIRQIQCKALRKCRMPSKKKLSQAITHKELKKDILGEEK